MRMLELHRLVASRVTALVAGALFAAQLAIAQAPPPAVELPPQYEVEVLVFAYRDFDPNEERFAQNLNGLDGETLREVPVFDDSNFGLLSGDSTLPQTPPPLDGQAQPIDPLAEALRVRPLRPEELELGSTFNRLKAISAYEAVLHGGWIQPGLAETEAQPFDLALLGAMNPRGTVKVHLSRFLHITLDLTLERPNAASNAPTPTGDGLSEVTFGPRYHLSTTRSVRSGELHYFDHPAFGVLVRVTPVPTQEVSTPGRRPAA
jgi:hypothetical protein